MRTKSMILGALCAALLSVFSLLSLPLGTVPLSLATFGVMLIGMLLGSKRGMLVVGVYLLLGVLGLPVYAGFQSGIGILLGPTGGYLISYLPMAFAVGLLEKGKEKKHFLPIGMLACAGATLLCYAVGTGWYMMITGADVRVAFSLCCLPFLPFDAVKCVAVPIVVRAVWRGIRRFS